MEAPEGTYACEGDKYLVYTGEYVSGALRYELTCVDSADDCAGLYVMEDLRMCINENCCAITYGGLAYTDGATRTCVTLSECVDVHHRYRTDVECMTAQRCKASSVKGYPYANTGECLALPPVSQDNFTIVDGEYYCEQYLDLTGEKAACIERGRCSGIPYDDKRACLPDDEYSNWRSYRVYVLVDGEDRSYVDFDTCSDMGRYAYRQGECSLLAPDNSGGFSF